MKVLSEGGVCDEGGECIESFECTVGPASFYSIDSVKRGFMIWAVDHDFLVSQEANTLGRNDLGTIHVLGVFSTP